MSKTKLILICFLINITSSDIFPNYIVSGKITTTDGIAVKLAQINFICASNTSRYFSAITDTFGNYNITITGMKSEEVATASFQLYQNYPNPFSEQTTITYQINQRAPIVVTIYNILGQRVKTFQRDFAEGSIGEVRWDGTDAFGKKVANGIYFYSLSAKGIRQVKKMLFIDNMTCGVSITPSAKASMPYTDDILYQDSGYVYTVYIDNTDSTDPMIELEKIENVFIQGDTVINFKVNEAPKWEFLGLDKEDIKSIAINPNYPDIIYAGSGMNFSAGTQGKLFKTTDGGINWDTLITGGSYKCIVIDPLHPETVYIAPWGILKTTDGGQTWQDASSGLQLDGEVRVQSLAINPEQTNILYAGTGGYGSGTLYKTISSGLYWWDLDTSYNNSLFSGVASLAIDPNNTDVIYAGTDGAGKLHKSIDGGINWFLTGLGETSSIIDMIAINPKSSNVIYAGVRFLGFWISDNFGIIWDSLKSNLFNTKFSTRAFVINPERINELYATNSQQAYKSSNNGLTWKLLSNDYENNLISIMYINPNGKYLYGGKSDNGIFRFKIW
jgi:hypothetical protein